MKFKLKSKLDRFNIAELLVGQDEWRSVPLVATDILYRRERRAVAYTGQQPETRGFHSYPLTQLWFTQRMCSLCSSAFRVGFWNRSSVKHRRTHQSKSGHLEKLCFTYRQGGGKKYRKEEVKKIEKEKSLVFILAQGCTVPRCRVAVATTYCTVTANTEWHKNTGTFEKPNKKWRNPRKKIYWQKLNHYNLPFKRE